MYGVELYAAVRLAVVDEGLSHHEAGRRFGIDRRTVKKMLSYSAPPGYRRTKPVKRPKLDGFTGIVDAILEADADPDVPRKQRHTAHRIFERLRDEHGFTGGYTIVKDYVRARRQSTREAFVPLHHPPGHAQVDFGEAVVEVGGRREKVAFFCLILPHSNVWFVKAYPKETTEAFLDGHVSAFAFLGGLPRSILYDNTTLAVARILGDGTRRRTQAFTHLQSHYLFRDRFGRPGIPNAVAGMKPLERDMLIVIDEMPRIGYLKPVMDGYTMAAGKGVHFWCFAQSISALDTSWGKEHRKTLIHLAELVQVLGFPRTDAEGAEELSKAIGTATFEGRTESKSGTIAESRIVTANTQWQAGESTSLVRERLVTPDELMTLGPDRQYVIAAAKDMPRDALYLHHACYWERRDAFFLADPNPFVLRKERAAQAGGSGRKRMRPGWIRRVVERAA